MKQFSIIAVFLCVLSSCATQRRCNMRFPPVIDTVYTVTTRDSIAWKDSIVYRFLPGKIVHDSVIIPCPDPGPEYVPDTARAETEYASAKAWYDFPSIQLQLEQKEQTLTFKLDSVIRQEYYWKSEYMKIRESKQVKYVPRLYKAALWILIGEAVMLILLILLKKLFK